MFNYSFDPSGGSSSGRNQSFRMRGEKRRRLRARKPRVGGSQADHAQEARPPKPPKAPKPSPMALYPQAFSRQPSPPKTPKPPKTAPHFLGPPVSRPKPPKKPKNTTGTWGY